IARLPEAGTILGSAHPALDTRYAPAGVGQQGRHCRMAQGLAHRGAVPHRRCPSTVSHRWGSEDLQISASDGAVCRPHQGHAAPSVRSVDQAGCTGGGGKNSQRSDAPATSSIPKRVCEVPGMVHKTSARPIQLHPSPGQAEIKHVLNRAVRDGVLNAFPMAQVKFLKESPGRLRFLSLEEEAQLCVEIGPPFGTWIRLAILTGLRQMEQLSLRWKCVDLERALLTIPHTKAGRTCTAPLNCGQVLEH